MAERNPVDKLALFDRAISFVMGVKTWKQLLIKIILIMVMFLMVVTWYKWTDIFPMIKGALVVDTRAIEMERTEKFNQSALEQLSIVHLTSNADFSAVLAFRPKNINYFVDIVEYQGKLPSQIDPKNLGGYPIDKTSEEYTNHINGLYYSSTTASSYLPTRDFVPVAYTFSCPYFNLDNYYSGSVLMEWYAKRPDIPDMKINIICGQAARILGRAR